MPAFILIIAPLLWASTATASHRLEVREVRSHGVLRYEPKRGSDSTSWALLQREQHRKKRQPALTDVKAKEPSIVYGVMTNGLPEYREKLVSQVETWAAGLSQQHRFFAVAGRGAPTTPRAGMIIEDRCDDTKMGLPCKEERLMEEGYDRNADWFVVLGEDNYVNRERFEEALRDHSRSLDSAVPTVLGIHGCGKGLGYCPEVDELGGLCGGGTYSLNRAAMEVVMADGKEALRKEYMARIIPGDMASSCVFRKRGIKFEPMLGLLANRMMKSSEFANVLLNGKPSTVHYCTANIMRWVHAVMQHQPDTEANALKAAAFDEGCCCAYTDADLKHCQEEVRASASQLQMEGQPLPPWSEFEREYIKERDTLLSKGL